MGRLTLLLTLSIPAATGQVAHAQQPPEPKALFASFEPLKLSLTANMREVFSNRDTAVVEWVPATLSWDGSGAPLAVPIELSTRGHFRLNPSNCKVPPLRVRFTAEDNGALWGGQKSLKLVTHCRDKYDQLVLQEYLAYRTYNILTDKSFRPRLARITYVDTRKPEKPETRWGFLLEDEEDMADRLAATLSKEMGVTFEIADSVQTALMSVFLFMIGNTDWSLPYLHNVKVIDQQFNFYPVPYDFDWSGIVNAPYAKPASRLRIRSVKQRVYRGPCYSRELMAATLTRFLGKRDAIRAEYQSLQGVEPKKLQESLEYLDEFFNIAADPDKVDRELRGACSR